MPQMVHLMNVEQAMSKLPLKEMDGTLLSLTILNSVPFAHVERVKRALEVAAYLHRGATRANRGIMPRDHYITHPLRNTLRLMRLGVNDIDVLIGSLLHDTVEDCFTEMLVLSGVTHSEGVPVNELSEADQIELVLDAVGESFGCDVERILRGVTNPVFPKGSSRLEREELYREHVMSAVSADKDVLLVKVADFIDNAGSLHYNVASDQSLVTKRVRKYKPLVAPLIICVEAADLDAGMRKEIAEALKRVGERLEVLESGK